MNEPAPKNCTNEFLPRTNEPTRRLVLRHFGLAQRPLSPDEEPHVLEATGGIIPRR